MTSLVVTIMPTDSRGQQQLAAAAQLLPTLDRYGYGRDPTLSHPRVTAIRRDEGLDDTAFSSSRPDDIATSSASVSDSQPWTSRRLDQPNLGLSHLIITLALAQSVPIKRVLLYDQNFSCHVLFLLNSLV